MMKAAFISLTEKGKELSLRIAQTADFISAERFCLRSHSDFGSRCFEDMAGLVSDIFHRYDALVFVCACGIAVRSIAPHIQSKTSDPAVVVIDEGGSFAIPILSGHLGGANALAQRLAELLGAQAVITTATDIGGHFSPDSFAVANGLIMTDMDAAKKITAAVLSGEKVGFVSEYECVALHKELSEDKDCRTGLYIGSKAIKPFSVTLRLIPKNIVLGIGCKRGTECEAIESAVISALKKADIPIERVTVAATADIKANEQGLLSFCKKFGLKFHTYSAQELMEVKGSFTVSEFVRAVTRADNICERSAVKCSGGKLILRKTASNGVTVAVAERPLILDFERKIL